MGKLVKFEIKTLPGLLVVGRAFTPGMEETMSPNNPLPGYWQECFEQRVFAPLEALGDYVYEDSTVGFMADFERGDGKYTYIIGMMMKPGVPVPEGYASYELPAGDVAIGYVQGKDIADIVCNAHEVTEHALREAGRANNGMSWCMEVYNCPRFTTPDENGLVILDYYIPVDRV